MGFSYKSFERKDVLWYNFCPFMSLRVDKEIEKASLVVSRGNTAFIFVPTFLHGYDQSCHPCGK